MQKQEIFRHSNTNCNNKNIDFNKLNRVFFIFLFSLVVLLPIESFAQPLAENKTKFVGNVIHDGNSIHSNFSNYWNQVTAENAGKWGYVENSPGSYNWTQLDNIYNYALSKGFQYKHHVLIWGQQYPSFISTLDSAQLYQDIVNWIQASGERYPDADFVDVVNEPLHSFTGASPWLYGPNIIQALGGSGETGWDWVIKAFELARQYWSPNTKLLINEYSVINDASANAQYIQLINLLKDRGLVDGIGIQGHNFEVNGGASLTTLATNLNNITATGLPVYITEFDISEQNDNVQLQKYQSIFPLLYENQGVYGITIWGYIQYEIWQANAYLLTERFAERPAMVWLRSYLAAPFRPLLISPVGTTDEIRNPILLWHASDSASTYHIQIATNSAFSLIVVDSTITDTLLQISPLDANTTYYWHVSALNEEAESPFSTAATFTTGDQILDVEEPNGIPAEFALSQNYPNPFNPVTNIGFRISESGFVTMKVYDVLGNEVATLVNEEKPAGNYEVEFDASTLTSGIYFYTINAGSFNQTKKMILLK